MAENYLIASMSVNQKGIVDSVKKLQQLKENIGPATAGGAVFSLASSSSSNLLKLFEALSWMVGIALGLVVGQYVPLEMRTEMFKGWATAYPNYAYICWIPLIILAGASVYVRYVYFFLFESVEHLYYTAMYDLFNNKDKIKSEVVHNLPN